MAATRLTDDQITGLLALHPEVENAEDNYPTYGMRITDYAGNTYLLYFRPGETSSDFVGFNITAYNKDGSVISPSVATQSSLSLWWNAIWSGTSDTIASNWNPFQLGSLANLLFIAISAFLIFRYNVIGQIKTAVK